MFASFDYEFKPGDEVTYKNGFGHFVVIQVHGVIATVEEYPHCIVTYSLRSSRGDVVFTTSHELKYYQPYNYNKVEVKGEEPVKDEVEQINPLDQVDESL